MDGQVLQEYFEGEKQLGVGMAVLGVAVLAAAFWVWRTQSGAFGGWLLVPLALMGVGFGAGGTALAMKTQAQVARLTAQLASEPGALVSAEVTRMARVNANWPRVKVAWSVVTAVALVLLLAMHREWASGLGLALMLLATTLFFVDVFAERRAAPYTAALERARAGAPGERQRPGDGKAP